MTVRIRPTLKHAEFNQNNTTWSAKANQIDAKKMNFLPPRSHLIRQFVKRHLVTLRREQHVLAQWLRQYFCQDHGRAQRKDDAPVPEIVCGCLVPVDFNILILTASRELALVWILPPREHS